jgi:hypothetical protein
VLCCLLTWTMDTRMEDFLASDGKVLVSIDRLQLPQPAYACVCLVQSQ